MKLAADDFDVCLNFDDDSPLTFEPEQPKGETQLPSPRRMTRKPKARRCVDLREQVDAAAKLIHPLPKPGESIHCLTSGEFVLASIIPAMIEAIGHPCAVTLGTLGTNTQTAELLAGMMSAGSIVKCTLLLSHYFEKADKETCGKVAAILRQCGATVIVSRSHAKLMLFGPIRTRDFFTIEGSANLRSSQNLEQLVLTNDAELYRFHLGWIEELKSCERN